MKGVVVARIKEIMSHLLKPVSLFLSDFIMSRSVEGGSMKLLQGTAKISSRANLEGSDPLSKR